MFRPDVHFVPMFICSLFLCHEISGVRKKNHYSPIVLFKGVGIVIHCRRTLSGRGQGGCSETSPRAGHRTPQLARYCRTPKIRRQSCFNQNSAALLSQQRAERDLLPVVG